MKGLVRRVVHLCGARPAAGDIRCDAAVLHGAGVDAEVEREDLGPDGDVLSVVPEGDALARDRIPGGLLLHQHLALVRHAALLEGVARGIGREQGDGRHQDVDFTVLDPLRVRGIGEKRRDHGLLRAIDVRRGALLRVGDLPRGVDGVTDASERGFGGTVERERRDGEVHGVIRVRTVAHVAVDAGIVGGADRAGRVPRRRANPRARHDFALERDRRVADGCGERLADRRPGTLVERLAVAGDQLLGDGFLREFGPAARHVGLDHPEEDLGEFLLGVLHDGDGGVEVGGIGVDVVDDGIDRRAQRRFLRLVLERVQQLERRVVPHGLVVLNVRIAEGRRRSAPS